ncbi:unnamed protein product [Staurois parvus]|uniref:Uncharacterized protein n=1 Tax=Staurois parvus TaxID=386267 RepID=A0ABN9E6E2_9NEOB|nr:unnamed protein product [Staurois parvus]
MGPLCPSPNSKKPMKKVPGASHGPPTDPGPSGSARVSKWSVRAYCQHVFCYISLMKIIIII